MGAKKGHQITKLILTHSILKLEAPDFAWYSIYTKRKKRPFISNLFLKYFFRIFGKDFKSLAQKMAELFSKVRVWDTIYLSIYLYVADYTVQTLASIQVYEFGQKASII